MEDVVKLTVQNGDFDVWVTKDFTLKVPDWEKFSFRELLEKHQMFTYWHNPNGPAVTHNKYKDDQPGKNLYFINGKPINDEEVIKKMNYRKSFQDEMETVLADETTPVKSVTKK